MKTKIFLVISFQTFGSVVVLKEEIEKPVRCISSGHVEVFKCKGNARCAFSQREIRDRADARKRIESVEHHRSYRPSPGSNYLHRAKTKGCNQASIPWRRAVFVCRARKAVSLDAALRDWLACTRAANLDVTDDILMTEAENLARQLGISSEDFSASHGFYKFLQGTAPSLAEDKSRRGERSAADHSIV